MTRISPLCVGSVRDSPRFSWAPALPSKTSSGWPGLPSFGSFIGTMFGGLGRIPTPPSRSYSASAQCLPGPDCSRQPKRRSPVVGDWVLVHMVSPLDWRRGCWALGLRGTPPGLAFIGRSGSAFPFRQQGRHPQTSFSELDPPAHRSLCLRFARYLTITNAKLEARIISLFLSCRALSSPTICRFIPAHCLTPAITM